MKIEQTVDIKSIEEKMEEWRLFVKNACPTLAGLLDYKKLDYKDLDLCSIVLALKSIGYTIKFC